MDKIDILFPSSSRPEFSAASLHALAHNTNWDLVRRLIIFTDGSPMREGFVARAPIPLEVLRYDHDHHGGPVGIMRDYLTDGIDRSTTAAGVTVAVDPAAIFAKIDNDVIVPPGWLDAAVDVMDRHPELDLLGLEPPLSRTAAPWSRGKPIPAPELESATHVGTRDGWNGYARCDAIGGVGLMRRRCFARGTPLVPHGTYGGFTDWQQQQPEVVKGWIVPPLSLFLLDRLPIEPWATYSRLYIAAGQQRPWTSYGPEASPLWEWWLQKPTR